MSILSEMFLFLVNYSFIIIIYIFPRVIKLSSFDSTKDFKSTKGGRDFRA